MTDTTAPAQVAGKFDFEVVQRNVLLSESLHGGHAVRIRGDVARLSDGTLSARWATPLSDGTPATSSAPYDPLADAATVRLGARPFDGAAFIAAQLESKLGGYHSLGPDADEQEVIRFRKEWPHVADRLCLDGPLLSFRLFDPGPVSYPKGPGAPDFWRAFIERHCSGDHGRNGEYDSKPLAADQEWTIDSQPVDVQNRAAIASRSGVVRSRFEIAADEQPHFAKATGSSRRVVVDVLTVMGRSGPRTLCTLANVDD